MEKKTILAACAAATLAFTGCSGGFSAAEEETIHAGKGEIMRILTVGNPADSLVLRQKAAPVTGRMLRTDDSSCAAGCSRRCRTRRTRA